MIKVRIYSVEEGHENNVPALVRAVETLREQYPDIDNRVNGNYFDRLFESLNPGTRVIKGPPAWVEWDNDVDYTAFLLKWS